MVRMAIAWKEMKWRMAPDDKTGDR
jgi:hypothetical protein